MQQKQIKTLLENNNFRNNQNYVLGINEKIDVTNISFKNKKITLGIGKYNYGLFIILFIINIGYLYQLSLGGKIIIHPFIIFFLSFYGFFIITFLIERLIIKKYIINHNIIVLKKKYKKYKFKEIFLNLYNYIIYKNK